MKSKIVDNGLLKVANVAQSKITWSLDLHFEVIFMPIFSINLQFKKKSKLAFFFFLNGEQSRKRIR